MAIPAIEYAVSSFEEIFCHNGQPIDLRLQSGFFPDFSDHTIRRCFAQMDGPADHIVIAAEFTLNKK